MRYEAEFTRQGVSVFFDLAGEYLKCGDEAERLAKLLGLYFTGILRARD